MKKYYAEQAIWGSDRRDIISFDTEEERDEFVRTTDYTSKLYIDEEDEELGENMEKVTLYGYEEDSGGDYIVDMSQETFLDEESGYEIYISEDGKWLADDDTVGWIMIRD